MDDEKKESPPSKSKFTLTISIIKNKLNLILHDKTTKSIYKSSFTPQLLKNCGFSDKQISNLSGIQKFIESAKAGHNDLKFVISIEKLDGKQDETKDNEEEDEGGVQGIDTAKSEAIASPAIQEYGVITISKEDDFFGTMKFIMKLPQAPRAQSDVNKDIISDLQTAIKTLQQQLVASQERENEMKKHQIPRGSIIMWAGAIDDVPEGWKLCDGNQGRPDLRDRFIIGAGNEYKVNSKGGDKAHSHNINVNGHQLTINEIPSHKHDFYKKVWICNDNSNSWSICDNGSSILRRDGTDGCVKTKDTGGNASHSHTASSSMNAHLPPYFAMAFIIKTI